MVSDNFKITWPNARRNGICGDMHNESKWDVPGDVQATYTSGQTIKLDVIFAQNHLGRVQFRICPLSAKKWRDCKLLDR